MSYQAAIVSFMLQGALLGMMAGFVPGPFTALIVSESIRHGTRAGLRCTLAPLITDPPIILFGLLVLSQVAGSNVLLGGISIIGSVLLVWIAMNCLNVRPEQFETVDASVKSGSLGKAIGINLLNPNPYVFWTTISGPIMLDAYQYGLLMPVLFVVTFYVVMLSMMVGQVVAAGTARHHLNPHWQARVSHLLGIAMFCFAAKFVWDGVLKLTGAG